MERSAGTWNLTCLVKDHTAPEFEEQVRQVRQKAEEFGRARKALVAGITQSDFGRFLRSLEDVSEEASVVTGYASLLYAADTQSDKATALLTRMKKLGADIANQTLFFELWWQKELDEKNAERLMRKAGELAGYLRYERLVSKYSLSEKEERIINTMGVTGRSALVKLYDKITGSFEYTVRVKSRNRRMNREELSNLVKDPNPRIRKVAYGALLGKFDRNKGVLGEIYQNMVLNWRDVGVQIRGYQTPISMRNISNDVDDATVEALLKTCRDSTRVFQEFFREKAKMISRRRLRRYDLYAPVDGAVPERSYSYDGAVRLVLDSLESFSPRLAGHAKDVLDRNHVDSSVRPGKRDGAFCSTISPRIAPFVFLSFTGKARDVFTLAHEMGHAIHSQAAAGRSILVQHAPLPLAETASTFSELLLYDTLAEVVEEDERRAMLASKIDDLYATIMRQSFFTLFEEEAHEMIAAGATVDEISRAYLGNLRRQFGGSVTLSHDFGIEWSCIPHFYHSPFYCYAYSFGNLLALSLYQRYKSEGAGFVPSYVKILAAGGSKKPESLLSEHGIDISSPAFWQDGFRYIERQVRDLSRS